MMRVVLGTLPERLYGWGSRHVQRISNQNPALSTGRSPQFLENESTRWRRKLVTHRLRGGVFQADPLVFRVLDVPRL